MKKIILCLSLISLLVLGALVGCKGKQDNHDNSSDANTSGSVSVNSITEEERQELEDAWQQMISGGNLVIETPGDPNVNSDSIFGSNISTNQSNVSSTTSDVTSNATSSQTSSTTPVDPESDENNWNFWVPLD